MHRAIEVPDVTGDRVTWLWSNEAERFVPIGKPVECGQAFDRTVQ